MSWDYSPAPPADATLWEDSRQPVISSPNGTHKSNNYSNNLVNCNANGGNYSQEVYTNTVIPDHHNRRERKEGSGYSESGADFSNCETKRISSTRNPYEEQVQQNDEAPTRPPIICRNCQEPGHEAFGCERPRKINRDHVTEMADKKSWNLIRQACNDRDLDDLKEAVEIYIKANPETTYQQLEKKFRDSNLGIYIIALEKELAPTYTNMDFQGNLDRTYTVTWRWSAKPMRPKEIPFWPKTPEENFERLGNAGEPTDRGVPKCNNCNTLGHTRKSCPEEPVENADRAVVMCINCQQVGHRVRDCTEPRPDKFAGRNNRDADDGNRDGQEPNSYEYGNGNDDGNYQNGRDSYQRDSNRGPIICRNCDEPGHISKECPLPRDYSRIKCQNCQRMGHTKVRCKEPLVEEQNEDNGHYDAGNNYNNPDTVAKNEFNGQHNDYNEPNFNNNVEDHKAWEQPSNSNNNDW